MFNVQCSRCNVQCSREKGRFNRKGREGYAKRLGKRNSKLQAPIFKERFQRENAKDLVYDF